MSWQGRNATITFDGKNYDAGDVLGFEITREPINATFDDAEWSIYVESECIAIRFCRIMKTKGKQPRTIAVWSKL